MKARWKRLGVLLITTTVCLVLAEVSYRTYLRRSHARVMAAFVAQNVPWEIRPGTDCAYVLRRGWRHSGQGWGFEINMQGFRGPLMEPTREGTRRVLVLGDSFTFGWGVGQGKSYPRLVQSRLAAAGARAVVFNAGVPGYNTVQQACLLEQIWQKAAPDVVVLGYVVNDAEPQHTVPVSPDALHRFVDLWLLERAKALVNRLGSEEAPIFQPRYHRHSLDYLRGFAAHSPKWRQSKDALGRMARYCRQRKVELLVFILPDLDEHFDESYRPAPIHTKVKQWGKELGVPVYDLLDRLRGKDHRVYKLEGGHPNEKGHAAMAAYVAEVLNKERGNKEQGTRNKEQGTGNRE